MESAPTATAAGATRPYRRRRWTGSAVALFAGFAVALTACSGNPAGSASGQSAQNSSSQGSAQSGAVAFAQCMRSHGVTDFPDPQNGKFLSSSSVQNNPNFSPAVQACQHLLGASGVSGGGGPGNSQLLVFAHCMQTHGVPKFPDPTANGGISLAPGVDPNSPQFQQAWQKCQSKLPGSLQGQQP